MEFTFANWVMKKIMSEYLQEFYLGGQRKKNDAYDKYRKMRGIVIRVSLADTIIAGSKEEELVGELVEYEQQTLSGLIS